MPDWVSVAVEGGFRRNCEENDATGERGRGGGGLSTRAGKG